MVSATPAALGQPGVIGDPLGRSGACTAQFDEPDPLYLGTLGVRSVGALVRGDPADLVTEFRGFAEALADPACGDSTRRRDICRGLACARALQGLLDVMIGEAISRRDLEEVSALGKQAERMARRVDALLTQHRAELSPRRPVLVVKAEHANVLAVEGAVS